ncbi:molybdopterin-dependent oxidoreductase [Halarcobacter anaerophilus]|uniref:molybdopterin-dependent oxidoreductase n=1 Tax=Halarcobacter anaerophilus TaxID=877500 RepID=UPI0005CB0AC1|nr:molybdopterin-dependent oxidoreductase [Halarcobacter anaerophilus]
MNSNNTIACPLDCFDACEAVLDEGKIKGNKNHLTTKSKLCVNFANLLKEDFLEDAYIDKQKVGLNEALEEFSKKLKELNPSNTLYYKGSGNLGVMQAYPKLFFAQYGSVFTKGSLCEGAGDEGIVQGRGKCVNPPLERLLASDVIIVWGRNYTLTSPHMYSLTKDKIFITVDPVLTPIAKKSELHLQINPKTDYELALLLTRFAYMEDMEDEELFKTSNAKEFLELAKSRTLISYEETTGVSLQDITKFFEIIKGKSVSILLGIGVQKYFEGVNITRAIDSFAAFIGLHNKQKGGLWYLGDSAYSYEAKFKVDVEKKVSLPEVDFSKYDLVFIQGANPVVSAPNTKRVIEGLKKSFVVFFGTTYNETCSYADIIIPASNFKSKKDVRLSYGHQYKAISYAVEKKQKNSLSEYEFSLYMSKKFAFKALPKFEETFDYYAKKEFVDESKVEKFNFLEELEVENFYAKKEKNEYYLLFRKRKNNLNSQFKEDNYLYINPDCNFNEGDSVIAKSSFGEASFILKFDEDIKKECIVLLAGNKKANYLTNHQSDEQASSAMFQEVLIKLDLQ